MRATITHLLSFMFLSAALLVDEVTGSDLYSDQLQPLDPGSGDANTVPAFPVPEASNQTTCRLDVSAELFGGVGEACGRGLDRSRCCPVLAAWLFAAHARSALEVARAPDSSSSGLDLSGLEPMRPDDSQRCVDALQASLRGRGIELARPNESCDAVLCFCGIRLHQLGSLSCPAAFNVGVRGATPTAAVRQLEHDCRNASYAGCTRCLHSLEKLKGGSNGGDRASRMFGRDCQLMGLTWLLARNKTTYIPTVSAVLRAILYSGHSPSSSSSNGQQYRCSPDQENMPLAVDSLQLEKLDSSSAAHSSLLAFGLIFYPIVGLLAVAAAAAHVVEP